MDGLGFKRLIPVLVICLGLLLPGCVSNHQAIFPAPEATNQTIIPLTLTPEDTSTPSVKIQIPTQAFFASKDIVIVYGQQEGDAVGDHFQDLMYVLNEPIVIIYSDGQALVQRENWFVEEWLSETQLCDLYARLRVSMEASELADRYSTSPTPEICISGCGGPSIYLRIAGGDSYLSHAAAIGEIMYLSPEYRLPLEIIGGFANSPFKDRFISDRIAIWYGMFNGSAIIQIMSPSH